MSTKRDRWYCDYYGRWLNGRPAKCRDCLARMTEGELLLLLNDSTTTVLTKESFAKALGITNQPTP